MSNEESAQEKLVGYGMLTFLSVIIWLPLIEWMNLYLPADSVGAAIGDFFWLAYPVLIIYLIYLTLVSVLYG